MKLLQTHCKVKVKGRHIETDFSKLSKKMLKKKEGGGEKVDLKK